LLHDTFCCRYLLLPIPFVTIPFVPIPFVPIPFVPIPFVQESASGGTNWVSKVDSIVSY